MAETVQKNLEVMAKEMQQFKELKIFKEDELKELLRRRKHYEYKINGTSKSLSDFEDYIKYETALLKLIRIRRGNTKNRCYAERRVIVRIKRLYQTAVTRFPQNLALAREYFKFCKKVNYIREARNVLSSMIKNHPKTVEVWSMASNFHFWSLKDSKTALKTLRKGLAIHKNDGSLFAQIIKLEVLDFVRETDSDVKTEDNSLNENEVLCIKKLELYLAEMMKINQGIDVYMKILHFLKNHKFTLPVQKTILNYIQTHYYEEVAKWNSGAPTYEIKYAISNE